MTTRCRLRDLGVVLGRYPTGAFNAITDVSGVRVGHTTLIEGDGPLVAGQGPVRTGVTAIMPNAGDIFTDRVVGGGFILNGAGELSGLMQVLEWGIIETPILLTNTFAVGTVSQATVRYMVERYPSIGVTHDVIIPLVGECDDSFLNDIAGQHVYDEHVFAALDNATGGVVAEGNVGGGTGMVTCDLAGGIGTSSRRLPDEDGGFTVGVLVMSNFGHLTDLRVDGIPVGAAMNERFATVGKRPGQAGSIIVVSATDAPLGTHQLSRLCKRVALGIGRVGSFAAHGSGEIILGFSTANTVPRDRASKVYQITLLADGGLDPLYQAVIESTEEAILNAITAADDMTGQGGHHAPALPLDLVQTLYERHHWAPQ